MGGGLDTSACYKADIVSNPPYYTKRDVIFLMNNDTSVKMLRNIFMINLGVFAIVHQIQRIDASCGFQAECIRLYSRHHIGITQWWPTIFTIGVTGSGTALISLLVVFWCHISHRQLSSQESPVSPVLIPSN